jgi:hypothetical protein
MSRGAALIRVDAGESDTRTPVPPRELEIAALGRKPPGASQPAGRPAKPVLRLKVELSRSGLGVHPPLEYFQLKLKLARALRRKLRIAIVEVDDCDQPAGNGEPFELTLDPPDPKRLVRLRAAVRRLLRPA